MVELRAIEWREKFGKLQGGKEIMSLLGDYCRLALVGERRLDRVYAKACQTISWKGSIQTARGFTTSR
jgi:hypothetical protein